MTAQATAIPAPRMPTTALSGSLVGHSPTIVTLRKQVARVAPSQATVLITGETGTGKELVARALHRWSDRSGQRMVPLSSSSLAEGMLEAEHGTVFLEEIGDFGLEAQADLLRVLQKQAVVPRGTDHPVKVDVRIIAATHRDLPALVREGRFLADLYDRLNEVAVHLPPLRERRQDIPLLIDHFLTTLAGRHSRGPIAIDPEAHELLVAHDWPGNVRELENVLERALVLADGEVIGSEHLPEGLRLSRASTATGSGAAPAPAEPPLELISLDELDRRHVFRVLAAMKGNREDSSRVLGISRRTLTRMIQRWGWKPGAR